MRIWFINRFFYPDDSASSQLLTDLATDLSDEFDVSVVCSNLVSSEPKSPLAAREKLGAIHIHRLRTSNLGKATLINKAVDLFSFHCSVLWFVVRHVQKSDLVILKTDPPLLQLGTTALVRFKGALVINWIQDIYPEIAQRLGKFPGPEWLFRALAHWRNRVLRAAQLNVVISPRMAEHLKQCGISNVQVIPNWSDDFHSDLMTSNSTSLRSKWGLNGKFIVMYSGNFGRVHSFSEIDTAVQLLADHPRVHFVFVGGGPALESLHNHITHSGIRNVTFRPFQPRDSLAESLGLADLHLVTLKAGMEDLLMPSKVYGVLSVGRPLAFVGEKESSIAELIRNEDLGFSIPLGNGAALAAAIEALETDLSRQQISRRNALSLYHRDYSQQIAVSRWHATILQYLTAI